jgi:orotate phosphoribosyltransferase
MIKDNTALKVAEFLLQIKAIKLQPDNPFTWASGIKSPIYCDNRKILSYPPIRTYIRQCFSAKIEDTFGKPDIIAGVATGGIAHGALVAQELGLPFVYVRSSAKGHGLGNIIEGDYKEGQSVVIIEDLISTGGSSLKAVEDLRAAKLNVKGLVSIFTYGFDVAQNNFEEANCIYKTLTNYEYLLDVAIDKNYITADQLATLREWKNDPENWMK